ncbi:glucuronyl esterase domain-containing protein [Rufibacter immobilis]|uniref:glucuronyl esterase domain-containing protein n=1 Tax=Rufibacter immobilis TaxID=1348778 RepID=UPI0035E74955
MYSVENTGAGYTPPPLPSFDQLPAIEPLTDPFMWSDGSGRSTNFKDWARRRNEIRAEIEHYEIGKKPTRPETITASFAPGTNGGVLTVNVTVNGQTLTLTSQISLPAGSGPFPAVIGMNSPTGSLPSDIFTNRNVARITYNHNQVTTYYGASLSDPYYRLYPDQNLSNAGQYSAWAWGVSRLIDGLELVQSTLPIDLKHLAVTGCSYAGKMALFSGALDERIALTIAQESGGGGAPAWRVSETLGSVEKLGATDYNWFKDDMRQFAGSNVSKLPHDHHELMAMIAPRALLVTGNTDFEWLANPSAYVSARATHEVYKTLGIGDRFGFFIDGGHGHCAIPTGQRPAIEAFVEKFLLDNTSANTNVMVHPYAGIDHERWYKWWGTGKPVLPAEPLGKRIWLEAECATVGSDWNTVTDTNAANGSYVTVKPGLNSTAAAPAGAGATVIFPFTIDSAATYNFVARLNAPTANDDSYWIKIDNGPFVTVNGLATSGWQWVRVSSANLSPGQHTITIAYREDGAHLDKLLVTTSGATITGLGSPGINCGQAPAITPGQTFKVSESAANNTSIDHVLATDPDTATVLQQWQITGGTGASIFAIDATTGQLTVADNSSLDFESSTRSYTLNVTVTDGYFTSAAETVTINLTNTNDNAPVVSSGVSFSFHDATCNVLGSITASDADDTNEPGFTTFQNWQIVGGTGAGKFTIDSQTGVVSIGTLSHRDLNQSSYTLSVVVSDGLHTSSPQTVTITLPAKVTICHKGQLITISKLALVSHLQHGDCVGACGDGSTNTQRLAVASAQSLQDDAVLIFPNPAIEHINIKLGANSRNIQKIQLLDLTGRVVTETLVGEASITSIPRKNLRAGTYLIRLQGDTVTTQKIIIQ